MPAPTDYHVLCRDKVADVLRAKLTEYGLLTSLCADGQVVAQVSLNLDLVTKPAVIVSFEGTEYEVGDGTNLRKDVGYPVLVVLATLGAKEDPTDLPLTLFRQIVADCFSGKRLSGVPEVMFCNYNGQPEIYQDSIPGVKDLRTAMTVTPIMRRLR